MNAKHFLAGLVELNANGDWDGQSLNDICRELFNCADAEVDSQGDVWIANPQAGHWLNDADVVRFAQFVCDRCNIETADALAL